MSVFGRWNVTRLGRQGADAIDRQSSMCYASVRASRLASVEAGAGRTSTFSFVVLVFQHVFTHFRYGHWFYPFTAGVPGDGVATLTFKGRLAPKQKGDRLMSSYEYYEFQAVDRPLTEEEQQAVAQLSSRVHPHPWKAVFVYHWGSFRADPEEILAQYYDAMLYLASWGSRQLMFRFPLSTLDLHQAAAYCQPLIVQDYISFAAKDPYVILKIEFHNEEWGGWMVGDGWLPPMLSLREQILRGDYRALYLAWLKTLQVEDLLDSVHEPPVPPGLKTLSPPLRTLVEFFEVDETLVHVAGEVSSERPALPERWQQRALSELPESERDAFLLRLAQGEPHLSVELNRRLRESIPLSRREQSSPRTVGQLRQKAEERRACERRRRVEAAEAKRIRDLETLARHEVETWAEIQTLIEQMQGKAYDEAVQLLVKLRDLAQYQRKDAAFRVRLNQIYEEYPRRSALLQRLRDAGLRPG